MSSIMGLHTCSVTYVTEFSRCNSSFLVQAYLKNFHGCCHNIKCKGLNTTKTEIGCLCVSCKTMSIYIAGGLRHKSIPVSHLPMFNPKLFAATVGSKICLSYRNSELFNSNGLPCHKFMSV